jgi:hypothetical protein
VEGDSDKMGFMNKAKKAILSNPDDSRIARAGFKVGQKSLDIFPKKEKKK